MLEVWLLMSAWIWKYAGNVVLWYRSVLKCLEDPTFCCWFTLVYILFKSSIFSYFCPKLLDFRPIIVAYRKKFWSGNLLLFLHEKHFSFICKFKYVTWSMWVHRSKKNRRNRQKRKCHLLKTMKCTNSTVILIMYLVLL